MLGPTLEAVCVDNLEVALPVLEALPQGWLQLIDTREGGSVSATIHASIDATLLSKVDAPPALQDVLTHIYVAADLPQKTGAAATGSAAIRAFESCVNPPLVGDPALNASALQGANSAGWS